jgi:hypothetical protein
LETTRTGHLSSLIEEFDGERDTLLLPKELIDSVTDFVSVGEIGKSSLQAVAMFYVVTSRYLWTYILLIDFNVSMFCYSSVLMNTCYLSSVNASRHCLLSGVAKAVAV